MTETDPTIKKQWPDKLVKLMKQYPEAHGLILDSYLIGFQCAMSEAVEIFYKKR